MDRRTYQTEKEGVESRSWETLVGWPRSVGDLFPAVVCSAAHTSCRSVRRRFLPGVNLQARGVAVGRSSCCRCGSWVSNGPSHARRGAILARLSGKAREKRDWGARRTGPRDHGRQGKRSKAEKGGQRAEDGATVRQYVGEARETKGLKDQGTTGVRNRRAAGQYVGASVGGEAVRRWAPSQRLKR